MAKKITMSKENIKKIINMYRLKNINIKDIAKKFSVSHFWINSKMKKMNIKRLYNDKEWLYQKHCIEKLQLKEIAKIANTSYDTISRRMKKFNIPVDVNIRRPSKYSYNYRYFDKIDTQDKAYWLGFINADGAIEYNQDNDTSQIRLTIGLSKKDAKHLKKLNSCLNSNIELTYSETYLEETGKHYPKCNLRICSKHLVDSLVNQNIRPNKSCNEKPPNIKDKELLRHYIRGYFDGDGSFSYWENSNTKKMNCSFNITTSLEMAEYISGFIESNLKISANPRVDKNNFRIDISNRYAQKVMNWLYKDSNIYLKRKYKKYNFWVNNYYLN